MPLVCGASYLTLCALWVILGNLHRVLLRSPVGLWPYASLWGSGTHLQKVLLITSTVKSSYCSLCGGGLACGDQGDRATPAVEFAIPDC